MAGPLFREDLDHVLAHTRDLWEDLRGARIFVTGGTGFFGCWLLETLVYANEKLGLNARATILTRDPSAFAKKASHLAGAAGIELLEGRVSDFSFPANAFSHVIHAAVDHADPLGLFASIVEGTRRTLEFARLCGARRYLLTSSGAVYGVQPPEMPHLPETYLGAPDPIRTRSAYGEGKRAAEFLCAAFHDAYGLHTIIARGFAFVGPQLPLDGNYAIGNFIRDALTGERIKINGDGTPFRSYLYAADLAIWLWTILLRGRPGQAYNVGSDEAVSILEVAHVVAETVNPQCKIAVGQQVIDPTILPSRYVPKIDLARRELSLEPWIKLSEGIRRTAQWHS